MPGDGEARLDLIDAKRTGDGVAIPGEGVVLEWKRSERNLEGLVLWPFRGRNAPPCPGEWVVETRSSSRSKWRPVKNVRFLICPGPEAPAKGKDPIHLFVEVLFDKVTARQVRIRAADGNTTSLVEIEAQVKAKRRR